jgi:glutamate N-acetyltransferase/amino-acid N-acetyltransferase
MSFQVGRYFLPNKDLNSMSISVPQGYRMSGAYCGIKRDATRYDMALIVSDRPATAAGVYTQNLVCAAPVQWDRSHTPSDRIRAVAVNSGNANACTGERGLHDAQQMATLAAQTCGATGDQALVLSTGVIGEFLPLEKIGAGIERLAGQLASDENALVAAARGMMTTDTMHKLSGRTLQLGGRTIQITGMAKGAAMIGPNMATMLGLILTDARLEPAAAQSLLKQAVEVSFNCVSVEGHMSTNDTVLLLANGAAGGPSLAGADLDTFSQAFTEVCMELARAIPNDGEGATHLITIEIAGCRTRADAMKIAKEVANSALVKTAIHGADPNWGRIVSAAGYAGVPFDPKGVSLHLNGFHLYQGGTPLPFDAHAVSTSIGAKREVLVQFRLSEGDAGIRFWTSDLTAEYIHLNADYHT